MGISNSKKDFTYAVPVNEDQKTLGETIVFRNEHSIGVDLFSKYSRFDLQTSLKPRFDDFPNEKAFARRKVDPATKTVTSEIEWFTNGQIRFKYEAIGSGLIELNMVPKISEWNNMTFNFVGVYSKNNLEYVMLDLACIFYAFTIVPIYDTLGEEATLFAFDQTKMSTCFLTFNHLSNILKLKEETKRFEFLKFLVIMDPLNITEDLTAKTESLGIRLITIDQLMEAGMKNPKPYRKVTSDTVYAFSYTSGTTGEPKGAMISHSNMGSTCAAIDHVVKPRPKEVYLSYLPLAHIMERVLLAYAMSRNYTVCMFNGDVLKLKEDLALFKPHLFASVPRLYNKFYDAIQAQFAQKSGLVKCLINKGVASKLNYLQNGVHYQHSIYDRLVFNKVKNVLGGNVRMAVTGSAPITGEVLDFLKIAFCCPILEAYGQTEGTALEFVTHENDPATGHVGGPAITVEFKLVDIPEMNYTSNDVDANGNPTPRGEIWVRGPGIISGYYKAEEKNLETFTKDGWMKSGDVGMLVYPEKRLRIIDRKKNIFKLAQGEYIAPEKLENIYRLAHPSISGCYVYGDSLKSCLVAVLNVEKPALEKLAAEIGVQDEPGTPLCNNPKVKEKYIEMMNDLAKKKKLNPLERVKDLIIETKTFQELGLLTEAMKIKRLDIRKHYQTNLDELYKKLI